METLPVVTQQPSQKRGEGMAYCRNCGAPISDKAVICPRCGVAQSGSGEGLNDSGSLGWGVLSFFLPIVGLILFLVWRQEKPKSARVSGIGALIGTGVNVMLSIDILIFYVGVIIVAAMSVVAV